MSRRVPQLLSVWNPYYEPHTIQVHVDILRAGRKVWWARLHRGRERFTEASARAKWKEAAALADAAADEGRELVMYVTNYQVLHALRIARVIFGSDLPEEEQPFVPPYYQRAGIPAGMWFEVTDVRALAWNQLDTLRFCLETGKIGNEYGYDPYASFLHKYPLVLDGAPVEEIFDPAHLKGRVERFCDLPETIYPPEVEIARRELARKLGGVWDFLEPKSQAFLASAWLIWGRLGHANGFDLSGALVGASRALETELGEGIFAPLHAIAAAAWGEEEASRRVYGTLERPRITLGFACHRIARLGEVASMLDLPRLARLAGDRAWHRWLNAFVKLRNHAAHADELPVQQARRRFREFFDEESPLRPLPPIKAELDQRAGRAANVRDAEPAQRALPFGPSR